MTKPSAAIDLDRLSAYLDEHIEGFAGPVTAEKFSGGQSNPTFLLTADSGRYVLRRKPPGILLQSAHAVDREYRIMTALKGTGVPVPETYALCEDDDVIGSMFFVMSFEDGRVFWDPALPDLPKEERSAYYHEMIRVLAALHEVDIDAVGLGDFGKPGNYFERQLNRWVKQYRASETETLPAMEKLIDWLSERLPEDDSQVSLIHGDFKLDNIMFAKSEPRALALLDWELSTLGHPLADLAYACMTLRIPPTPDFKGLGGLDRQALGIPSEQDMIDEYCRLRNIESIENWPFYLAFSFFRLGAIAQGVMKRAIDGNASSEKAMQVGKLAGILAQLALNTIDECERG